MNIYFLNTYGKRKQIGTASTQEEIFKIINKFLDEHNYKSYYTRTWTEKDEMWVDVGSHTEFFIIK